jgi:hypothetical protein
MVFVATFVLFVGVTFGTTYIGEKMWYGPHQGIFSKDTASKSDEDKNSSKENNN